MTVDYPLLKEEGERLGRTLAHIGNLDVDIILQDGTPYFLEMNARFGGAYPFSHLAEVNLPKVIVQWLRREPHDPSLLIAEPNIVSFTISCPSSSKARTQKGIKPCTLPTIVKRKDKKSIESIRSARHHQRGRKRPTESHAHCLPSSQAKSSAKTRGNDFNSTICIYSYSFKSLISNSE